MHPSAKFSVIGVLNIALSLFYGEVNYFYRQVINS